MMFDLLAKNGVPLGPLDEPTLVHRVGTGGKIHYDATCQPHAAPVHLRLSTFNTADVCSKCRNLMPAALDTWTEVGVELAAWMELAREVAATGTVAANRWIGPTEKVLPGLISGRLFLVERRLATRVPELSTWANNVLAPVLRDAMARLEQGPNPPEFTEPGWVDRITALAALGDLRSNRGEFTVPLPRCSALGGHKSLLKEVGGKWYLTDADNGNILLKARSAFSTTWRQSGDIDAAKAAGLAAGIAQLEQLAPATLDQLPADLLVSDAAAACEPGTTVLDALLSAWSQAARDEVAAIVDAMAAAITRDDAVGGPSVMATFRCEVAAPGAKSGLAAQMIRLHTVGVVRVGPDPAEATLVTVMPERTYEAVTTSMGLVRNHADFHCWGEVSADEDPAILETAVTLFKRLLPVGRAEAIDLARATAT